jgi:hypothetical protein
MRPALLPSELTFADKIGRRAAPRLHLSIPAKLMSVVETQSCVLVDVSQTGARIRLDRPLAVNTSGYLKVGPLDVFVTALRHTPHEAGGGINGLEFEIRLTKSEVLALRAYAEDFEMAERRAFRRQAQNWVMGGA